ncbi:MAG TPA: hypothetical protein VLF18_19840 [Tahibacter sp.]|uniref:hypothetical protein n=1 Tax=Tahibacter sp. TaxID=2056211 RepID=UPI002BF7DE31|nr:hypothetical protein [Tahibacter sp.]HSX62443.1 hypothetical protein [Tahibacter sp.]
MSFQPGWYSTPSLGPNSFQYFQTPNLVTAQGYFDGSNQILQWGTEQFPNGQPGQWTPDMQALEKADAGDWWDNPKTGRVKPNNQRKPGPIANTQGIIVPQTSPNLSGSTSAPTPKAPEGQEEKGWWKSWGSAVTHGVLDVVGMIPVVGEPANLIGAGIYALEGDYVSAAMDLAAMIPTGGQAATAAKYGRKVGNEVVEQAAKKTDDAAEVVAKQSDEAAEAAAKQSDEAAAAAGKNNSGGKVKGKKKLDCGQMGKYGELQKFDAESAGMERDHIPPQAALSERAFQLANKQGLALSAAERKALAERVGRHALTISIPKDIHSEGLTNSNPNNKNAAGDLQRIAREESRQHRENMRRSDKHHKCLGALQKATGKIGKITNQQYDKFLQNVIDDFVSGKRTTNPWKGIL